MANKIATTYQYDANNVKYTIDIYHKTDATSTITFNGVYTLKQVWEGGDPDQLWGVYPSRFDVSLHVENATQENLINIMLGSYENDIYCEVYRSPSPYTVDTLIFKGYLLVDIIKRENAPYPFALDLTFTDSLGKASELDFDSSYISTGFYGALTLINRSLYSLEVDDLYGTTDDFIKVMKGYVPDGFTYNFNRIVFSLYGFSREEENTDIKPIKISDILNELCRVFNARFYYADGLYHFESIDARCNANVEWTLYDKQPVGADSGSMANSKLQLDHSTHEIIKGASIYYYPALRYAKCTYPVGNTNLLVDYLFDADNYTTLQDIVYLIKNDTSYLKFNFGYYELAEIVGTYPTDVVPVRYKYKATIKVGSYYLSRDISSWSNGNPVYDTVEWTTSISDYYFVGAVRIGVPYYDPALYPEYTIITPPLEADGTLSVLVALEGLVELDGTAADPGDVTDTANTAKFSSCYAYGEDGDALEQYSYAAENDTNNHKIIETDGLFLDFEGNNQNHSIRWNNNDGTYDFTNGWTVYGESPSVSKKIQQHQIRSIIHLRQTHRELHTMSVIHDESYFNPYHLIQYKNDGANYEDHMILRLDYDILNNISSLDMFHLEKGANEPTLSEASKIGETFVKNTELTKYSEQEEETDDIKTTDMITSAPDITSIPITGMIGDYFEGDKMKIISPTFPFYSADSLGKIFDVRLYQDCFDGETTMYVFDKDLTNGGGGTTSYIAGCIVRPYPRPQFRTQRYDVTTNAYLEPTVTIPSTTTYSDAAIRRKVKVYYQEQLMEWAGDGNAPSHPMEYGIVNGTNRITLFGANAGRYRTEIEPIN